MRLQQYQKFTNVQVFLCVTTRNSGAASFKTRCIVQNLNFSIIFHAKSELKKHLCSVFFSRADRKMMMINNKKIIPDQSYIPGGVCGSIPDLEMVSR